MTRLKVTTALLCGCLLCAAPTAAAPISFGGNAYEFIAGVFSFGEANAAAQAQTFNSASGHLVAITSDAEDAFVLSLISSIEHSVSIGAADLGVEGAWRWVTGEQFWQGGSGGSVGPDILYANWADGQPDDFGDGQDVATIFGGAVPDLAGRWDDGGSGPGVGGGIFQRDGYIVEFEGVAATVPEPATLLLLGAGLSAAAFRSRRKPRV